MCRGNNKQVVFHDDSDKLFYWKLLKELKTENKIDIFHYCIMATHIHFIAWIIQMSRFAKFMKQLNLSYYNFYRRKYGYYGHVWQGRYKSNVIETNVYLLQCGKYIELNPVRAGMVRMPEDYRFSSYRHYAFGIPDDVVSDSPEYIELAEHPLARRERYIKFVVNDILVNSAKLARAAIIGSDRYIEALCRQNGIKMGIPLIGRPRKKREASPFFEG